MNTTDKVTKINFIIERTKKYDYARNNKKPIYR